MSQGIFGTHNIRLCMVFSTETLKSTHGMVTSHTLWMYFMYLTNHISIVQLMGTLYHGQFFGTKSAA